MAGTWLNPQSLPKRPMRVGAPGVVGGSLTTNQWGMKGPAVGGYGGVPFGSDEPVSITAGMSSGWGANLPVMPRRLGGGVGMGVSTVGPSVGGGGGYGGGRRPVPAIATYAPRVQRKIYSDRDGSTVAPMARGHSGPLSPDYSRSFGGLDEFDAMQERGPAVGGSEEPTFGGHVASGEGLYFNDERIFAEGTKGVPVAPGVAFVAGDSKDGKPNPELIVPTPMGVHVEPLKNMKHLPKMAEGTGSLRYPGSDVTRGDPAENMLFLKPNTYSSGAVPGFSVFDGDAPFAPAPDPNVVPVSELPAGSRIPAVRDPLRAVGVVDGEADRSVRAPVRFANPEGIEVGVTPRAALTRPAAYPDMAGEAEARRFERAEKLVWRAARDNPMLARALMQDREAAEAALAASRARAQVAQFTQQNLNARNQANIDAANARFEVTRKERGEERRVKEESEAANVSRRLHGNAVLATNLQMQGVLPPDQVMNLMMMTDPEQQEMLLKRAAFNTPAASAGQGVPFPGAAGGGQSGDGQTAAPWKGVPFKQEANDVMPGSGIRRLGMGGPPAPASPPAGDPRDWESVPVAVDPITNKPTQHQWLPKRKEADDRDTVIDRMDRLYERLEKAESAGSRSLLEKEIKRLEKELDANGDGKVSPAEAAAGGGGAPDPNAAPGETPAARAARLLRERALKK